MTIHTLCFRSLIEKVTDVWNSEVDSIEKISKMAAFIFFSREQLSVLLLRSELDMLCSC